MIKKSRQFKATTHVIKVIVGTNHSMIHIVGEKNDKLSFIQRLKKSFNYLKKGYSEGICFIDNKEGFKSFLQ